MALANVAVLLAREGKKVLVVDFDLEAPGLDRYFTNRRFDPPTEDAAKTEPIGGVTCSRSSSEAPGIVDLLTSISMGPPQNQEEPATRQSMLNSARTMSAVKGANQWRDCLIEVTIDYYRRAHPSSRLTCIFAGKRDDSYFTRLGNLD
jgi:hypothetical protein